MNQAEERNVDIQDSWCRGRSVGRDRNTGAGAAGDLRARLLRIFLPLRELPEQGAGQSLHGSQLPAWARAKWRVVIGGNRRRCGKTAADASFGSLNAPYAVATTGNTLTGRDAAAQGAAFCLRLFQRSIDRREIGGE